MADMGIGEMIMLAAAVGSTGAAVYGATKGGPKLPGAPQEAKSPTADAFRRQNAASLSPGAAMTQGSTLLSGSGPSQNVGTSTLLGQ